MATRFINDAIIDSRDINDAVEDLESRLEHGELASDNEELKTLRAVVAEGRDLLEDWDHGVILVKEEDFVNHAQELHEDINGGTVETWPFNFIDWKAAAEALKSDYSVLEFEGTTYYAR